MLDRFAAFSWRVLLIAAFTIFIVFVAAQLRLLVLPLIVGIMIATVLTPPVDRLQRFGLKRGLATALVMLTAVLLLAGAFSVIVPQVIAEAGDLQENVIEGIEEIKVWLSEGPFNIPRETVDEYWENVQEQFEASVPNILAGILSQASLGLEIMVGIILTLPITFFIVNDGSKIRDWCLDSLAGSQREFARVVASRAWRSLGTYIKGLAVLGFIDASLIATGLLIIGVPLVAPIALLTFFMAFIPVVGATLAGAVAVLVALVSGGAVDALLTLAVVVGVQQLEGNLMAPFILGRAVHLHPLVILMAVTGGGILGGVIGAFLSVPIAAMLAGVLEEFRQIGVSPIPEESEQPEGAGDDEVVEDQQQRSGATG
ncbi:MAG: AI-2E family transporter [Chloroflexota bacterium]